MADHDLRDVVLAREAGDRFHPIAGLRCEDTERAGEDAKLIAERDPDPTLSVIDPEHPTDDVLITAHRRTSGEQRPRHRGHFGAWTVTSTR